MDQSSNERTQPTDKEDAVDVAARQLIESLRQGGLEGKQAQAFLLELQARINAARTREEAVEGIRACAASFPERENV